MVTGGSHEYTVATNPCSRPVVYAAIAFFSRRRERCPYSSYTQGTSSQQHRLRPACRRSPVITINYRRTHNRSWQCHVTPAAESYALHGDGLGSKDGYGWLNIRIIRIRIRLKYQYGYPYSYSILIWMSYGCIRIRL